MLSRMRIVIPSLIAATAVSLPAFASADDGVSVCNEAENSPRGGYVVTDGPIDPVPPAFLRGSQMRVGNGHGAGLEDAAEHSPALRGSAAPRGRQPVAVGATSERAPLGQAAAATRGGARSIPHVSVPHRLLSTARFAARRILVGSRSGIRCRFVVMNVRVNLGERPLAAPQLAAVPRYDH